MTSGPSQDPVKGVAALLALGLSNRGHGLLLVTATSLTLFTYAVRYWWLETEDRIAQAHEQFELLVSTAEAPPPETSYHPLATLALQLGYVDTDLRCADSGAPDEACAWRTELLSLPTVSEPPFRPTIGWLEDGPVVRHRNTAADMETARALHVPSFLRGQASIPADAARFERAVAAWWTLRSHVVEVTQGHAGATPPQAPPSDLASIYFISVDGIMAIHEFHGDGARERVAAAERDFRRSSLLAHGVGRRAGNPYRSGPYIDLAGYGAVLTECVGVPDEFAERPARDIGVLCIDFMLPVGEAPASSLAEHGLVRVRGGRVEVVGAHDWLDGDRVRDIEARLLGREAVLRAVLSESDVVGRVVESTGGEAGGERTEEAAAALAERVVSTIRADPGGSFDGVVAMAPVGQNFWALVPLRREPDSVLYVAVRPRRQELPWSLYASLALGAITAFVAAFAVRERQVTKAAEERSGVMQSLQGGVIAGGLRARASDGEHACDIDQANDRAEELFDVPLPGFDHGVGADSIPGRYMRELVESEWVYQIDPDRARARPELTDLVRRNLDDIGRQRARGEVSDYYVRTLRADGRPRSRLDEGREHLYWLRIIGTPELRGTGRSFGTVVRVHVDLARVLESRYRADRYGADTSS